MKIKLSWIPFIPVAVLSVVLRVYQLLFVENEVDTGFLSSGMIWVVYTCMVAVLFFVLLLLCMADRKTPCKYRPKTNFLAGLFGVLSAGCIIFNAGIGLGDMLSPGINGGINITVASFVDVVFGTLGGIAILIMAISSFSGRNFAKNMGVFSVTAPLWCCVKLFTTFISYTKQSVHAFDMTDLFYMAFLTLAVFNAAIIYQEIECKNPVKGLFLYGMPGVVVVTVYTVADVIKQLGENGSYDIMGSLNTVSFLLVGMYILFMMIEITLNIKEDMEQKTKPVSIIHTDDVFVDEVAQADSVKSGNSHIDITDVEEEVNKDLDDVDNILDDIQYDDENPEKYAPTSEKYFDRKDVKSALDDLDDFDNDEELSKSMKDIDDIISWIEEDSKN